MTQSGVAVDIGVNQGAIIRKLGHNRGFRGYRFLQTHHFAMQKGLARKGVARMMTPCLIVRAETLLRDKQWSHQQIYGACTQEDGKKKKFSYESLYRHIKSFKHTGGTPYLNLLQRGKNRNKRDPATAGRGLIAGRVDIPIM